MPEQLAHDWLNALRSGEYEQGSGRLECDGKYCCLGVLQMIADGEVETHDDDLFSLAVPSDSWYENHDIIFADSIRDESSLDRIPYAIYKMNDYYLTELNDQYKLSFKKIADILEDSIETF